VSLKIIVLAVLFALSTAVTSSATAQSKLTNESVVKLVGSGIGEDLILQMIRSQPGDYTIDPDAIVQLKTSGVPEKIISAMVAKKAGTGTSESYVGDPTSPSSHPSELGVYYRKEGTWTKLLPEVVNWKTGGVLKSISTIGIVNRDVNGNVAGKSSRTAVTQPLEILIYTAEGVEITEYQLLKLRQNSDNREFRTVTGGVFHASGGSKRDLVPYESKEVENRKHLITLEKLEPGEYGLLPPGVLSSSSASAQLGKLHSFRIQ
jgi:hypothetical protein